MRRYIMENRLKLVLGILFLFFCANGARLVLWFIPANYMGMILFGFIFLPLAVMDGIKSERLGTRHTVGLIIGAILIFLGQQVVAENQCYHYWEENMGGLKVTYYRPALQDRGTITIWESSPDGHEFIAAQQDCTYRGQNPPVAMYDPRQQRHQIILAAGGKWGESEAEIVTPLRTNPIQTYSIGSMPEKGRRTLWAYKWLMEDAKRSYEKYNRECPYTWQDYREVEYRINLSIDRNDEPI